MAAVGPCVITQYVGESEGQSSVQEENPKEDEHKVTDGSASNCDIVMENYSQQSLQWPSRGQHILAHFDDKFVVVYQAFNPFIADYAVKHQRFGGPNYNLNRMTWIKTNFMWMMYRCGWAQKVDQQKVLAIRLTREGFEDILSRAFTAQKQKEMKFETKDIDVRLQWDPDHSPNGEKLVRRAIQIGLKGQAVLDYTMKYITSIQDITDFVHNQFITLQKVGQHAILTPRERVYMPSSCQTCCQIGLDFVAEQSVVSFGT